MFYVLYGGYALQVDSSGYAGRLICHRPCQPLQSTSHSLDFLAEFITTQVDSGNICAVSDISTSSAFGDNNFVRGDTWQRHDVVFGTHNRSGKQAEDGVRIVGEVRWTLKRVLIEKHASFVAGTYWRSADLAVTARDTLVIFVHAFLRGLIAM